MCVPNIHITDTHCSPVWQDLVWILYLRINSDLCSTLFHCILVWISCHSGMCHNHHILTPINPNLSYVYKIKAIKPSTLTWKYWYQNEMFSRSLIHWCRVRLMIYDYKSYPQNHFVRAQNKESIEAPHHWSLLGESTNRRWFPLTKQRTSDAKKVAMSWRHNAKLFPWTSLL